MLYSLPIQTVKYWYMAESCADERSMQQPLAADADERQRRPFTLGDAMILIIALALGLAVGRPVIILLALKIRSLPPNYFRSLGAALALARTLNTMVLCFLYFLLPAFVILRLKRPRAPLRSVIRQPGFVACAAPCAVFLASLPLALLGASGLAGRIIETSIRVLLVAAAPVVWVSLIATRRWYPEPSCIDRFGRFLGALWMVSVPVIWF
jgi:hypothetical protein